MADRNQRWTTVRPSHGHAPSTLTFDRVREAEKELEELEAIEAWDQDDHWPGVHKPLFNGPDAKRFDARLSKLDDLGYGAFGRVEKVTYGSVCLARKRIPRRRGFSIDELRQEGLTMRKLDHRHVVKIVATYAPRAHELCLLIWPAAVCNLSILLDDIESLRLGEGDRDDILERLDLLDLKDLSAIEPSADIQRHDSTAKCPLEFLRNVAGCVARAMAHCHANDVRHLDIKPSNILLKADRVYLADFGISRDVSGQEQTTTEGLPGSEKWRAPELYSDLASSMKLSDIYSLGLVFLNIATVLYNARLQDFDDALVYSSRLSREEQLRIREEKINGHIDRLRAHALVTPPFMFTYEGQETVRPRPLVNLISRMVASRPQSRPSADKVDVKLSMLGGIHQIYHSECCKRPISWVEDKWDGKFKDLISLRTENDRLRKRIGELEGKDKTYELRLEHERQRHEQDVGMLQAKLREAEEHCRALERDKEELIKKSTGRGLPRHSLPTPKRNSASGPVGLGLSSIAKTQSTPTTPAGRPPLLPSSRSAQRIISESTPSWPIRPAPTVTQSSSIPRHCTDSPPQRSPSSTSLAEHVLRSRGSGSKLPLPVTPNRANTPNLNRDQSLTDSSMASSIFSRHSIETTPTPAQNSPAINPSPQVSAEQLGPNWGKLEGKPPAEPERPSTPPQNSTTSGPSSPSISASPSVMSSPRTVRSDLAPDTTGDGDTTARPRVPSLKPLKSWAEVAKVERRRLMNRAQA